MADAKAAAPAVNGQKVPWNKLGSVTVYNTNNKGQKRQTKTGNVYFAGSGTVDGKECYVTVMPSREGMMSVFIEEIPAKQ